MTREEIEQLNDVRPYCFETDMEEDWYKIGCIDGLKMPNPIQRVFGMMQAKNRDLTNGFLHKSAMMLLIHS